LPPTSSIAERLTASRRDLLDLGLRNTLLNYRLPRSRGAQVVGCKASDVYQWLVTDGRTLDFLPAKVELSNGSLFPDPREESRPAFPTSHDEQNLHSRLLATYYAARTHIEERGLNILFVAVGMLHWFEDDSSEKEIRAPLLLIPVKLERTSAREKFKLSYNDEDIEANLSLATRLHSDFGIDYPELPDTDELDVDEYLNAISAGIRGQQRWRVEPNEISLGFFSFAKFLMYRDLEPSAWCSQNNPDGSPILAALVRDGFRNEPSGTPDDAYLDRVIAPDVLSQVVDADSSQAMAMLDVRSGRNLVIQGPPGTGKSQTITNIIADALAQDKKVLFVAEKRAALEVVKRRLDKVNLGDVCLELHSHAANKKSVLSDLQRTLELGRPRADAVQWQLEQYKRARDQLNAYCLAVNTPIGNTGFSPHDLMGRLISIAKTKGDAVLPKPIFRTPKDREFLSRLLELNRMKVEELRSLVINLQEHLKKMGPPSAHPFRGTGLQALLPSDKEHIAASLRRSLNASETLDKVTKGIATLMGIAAASSRTEADLLNRAAKRALSAPHLGGVELKAREWQARRDDIGNLIAAGARHAEVTSEFASVLIPEAWEQDVLLSRQILNTIGRKWWRWLSADYRKARNSIAGLCTADQPKDTDFLCRIVDAILEATRQRRTISEYEALATRLYGVQWEGLRSDWQVLKRLADWIFALYRDVGGGQLPVGIIDFLSGNPALSNLKTRSGELEAALPQYDGALAEVFGALLLDEGDQKAIAAAELPKQIVEFSTMLERIDELGDGIAYRNFTTALSSNGLGWVADAAWDWAEAGRLLETFFLRTCFEGLLRSAQTERESLRRFDGVSHEGVRNRFCDFDAISLKAAQLELAAKHHAGLPSPNGYGEVGVLLREFAKRSRHLPIRKLVQQAGNAIQAIKPVFMMSPMSIAAFVPPSSVKFDLVVFDEASQVRPVEAFGAVLRGDQIVVVGDSRQLPPTSFFDALIQEDEPVDDEELVTSDIESVLGLMLGQGAPQRMLRWHYRSRHESLITVSNEEFYDKQLVVFPSPEPRRRGLGLVFHHLPNTVYDRGKSRTNRQEAEIVAKAVMLHAKSSPHLTLGVAAFSLQQADAVLDCLERMRRDDPSAEAFFAAHPDEPFFVKNLESVQGDERDVIYISIGYGKNAEGYAAMGFGALNTQGGERRLNVLITRARQCCEVFTNLTHGDIDLSRTPSRGVAALKTFLKYAQVGITDIPHATTDEEDSPFEGEVASALRRAGHEIATQVGSGGFRIDLAVIDPRKRGNYLLGIECDGATYHRSRSSRDRDRLRQRVLENLGWKIHRIWSTDWFNHPERELRRTLGAIEQARLQQDTERPSSRPNAVLPETETPATRLEREEGLEERRGDPVSIPKYRISTPSVSLRGLQLHQVPARRMGAWIEEVVRIESPIHKSEIAHRIAEAAGVQRIGSRIESTIKLALSEAVRAKLIRQRGEFFWSLDMASAVVRDRSDLPNASRKLELVAPEELSEAIMTVVKRSFGISLADIPQAVCRLLGFGRTSEDMGALVDSIVRKLSTAGTLLIADGHVTPSESTADAKPVLKIVKGADDH
jgi:very-short-patch-repair endonuclease